MSGNFGFDQSVRGSHNFFSKKVPKNAHFWEKKQIPPVPPVNDPPHIMVFRTYLVVIAHLQDRVFNAIAVEEN